MKLLHFNIWLAGCFFILGCKQPITNARPKIDTSKSFKIDTFWVTPKHTIDFNSLTKTGTDTLDIAICGEYVYSPFGSIKDKSKFSSSLLKNFNVFDRTISADSVPIVLQVLKHNSSKLMFYFNNDPDAFKHSDIFKGEIYDSDVQFVNGIKIGMSVDAFYKSLFDYFPDELKNKYKFFVLESCVTGIKHIYKFENDKLKSVEFVTDYTFKSDY